MEYKEPPENRINSRWESDTPQIFRMLRNIDLNLLTIFEAVYVHKGIVNAAKILNLTPSAISQSIQKLRTIFPDPLFIRKGQGVTPTAYATHLHEYISQGLDSILAALDLSGGYDKQRTITIGTSPTVGAIVMPAIYQSVRSQFPQILLRNIAVTDASVQLSQFQADLVIDTHIASARTLGHHLLYSDSLVLVGRQDHPVLSAFAPHEAIAQYEYTLLMMEGAAHANLRKRIYEIFPERQISFSSYNLVTIAALIGNSDLLGLMPLRCFSLFSRCWPLQVIDFPVIADESVDVALHYNKLSLRDAMLQNVIAAIRQVF
ncbi:YbeF family transcriptional regulator [Pluralibacter sp.]|uniref:YbeF family transcriptional regulator n=1 Tax=Pluralibacter sp. TaxID=1920032 RepID=UPI0025D7D779|nr:YbeF family transcriptional regulator [Pluralibacter sp.]